MADSTLEAIETSIVATMLTVAGVEAAKAVPASEMFKPQPNNPESSWLPTLPDAYPGCVVSLNDDEVEAYAIEGDGAPVRQYPGGASICERVPVYIAIYATSNGTTQTGARYLAWQITEAAKQTLMVSTPTGAPTGTTVWPYMYEQTRPIVVDVNTHGMLLKVWAVYKTRFTA